MDEYDIYIRGFAADRDETPEQRLARVFGLDARRAHEFVQSLPRVAKRHVPAKYAARYALSLRELGADFELRKSAIHPQVIIAVEGSAEHENSRAQLHGGTLTLPPPNDGPIAVTAAPAPLAESPFAHTVVEGERAPDAALFAPGASPYDTLRESTPPVGLRNATIREASPPQVPALPATYTWPEQRPPSAWPPPAPPAASIPAPHAAATPAASSPWAPIEPQAPGDVPTPNAWSPPVSLAPPAARAPQYAPAPALGFGGRPEWLVAGSHLYEQSGEPLYAPAGSAPSVGMPQYGEPDAPAGESDAGLALDSVPARAHAPMSRRPETARAIGVAIGRELPTGELPMPLRIGLRIAMGVSLFVIFSTLRHCRSFDSDVEKALAPWENRAVAVAEGSDSRGAERAPSHYGPAAAEWLESDLNQCSSGDKDRARHLVNRYKQAGAVEVYVGGIMRSGPVQIAGELIVELPRDEERRKAVLAEHRRVLEAAFGGFVPADSDPGGPVVRVTM